MFDVFCISAGQLEIKKDDNIINKKNMYLNYGLLSLATILRTNNLNPIQIQGHFTPPEDFFQYAVELGLAESQYPIFISIPSFYAISWVNEFTKLIKSSNINTEIIVGGRWVVDGEPELLKSLLPNIDHVVDGVGETKILSFIKNEIVELPQRTGPTLDYSLLDQRHLYQPSIEVSRGCGMSCSFCQERDEKLQPLKPITTLIEETKHTLLTDNLIKMTPYLEASMFVPSDKWLKQLVEARELHSMTFNWRTESRVDSIPIKHIPLLAKAGLKVIDLGLESASFEQLRNMGKSMYPEKYLQKASLLINTAYEYGIDVKINILLYAGETHKTLTDTFNWLERHRSFIKGVSIGPVIAFGWKHKKKDFVNSMEKLGASVANNNSVYGVTHINLSSQINNNDALKLSKELSREFMTAKDYFDLKSFSYFPRNYEYKDFLADIKREQGAYSFSTCS